MQEEPQKPKPPRRRKTKGGKLTLPRLLTLLEVVRSHSERDFVLFLTAFSNALRASEATSLKPSNYDFGPSGIYITVQRLKKSDRTRRLVLDHSNPLLDEKTAIEAWLRKHGERWGEWAAGERLFPISRIQFYRLFRKYVAEAGLPEHLAHPHILKHSRVHDWIAQMSLNLVQRRTGNRTLASIAQYLGVDDDEADEAEGKRER